MKTFHRLAIAAAMSVWLIAPALSQELRIGLAAPLSGPNAVFGDQIRLGVERAVADLNASGGFLGRRAKVVPGDDGGDTKKGVDIAKAFVASGIGFVIGPLSSAVAVPASTVYADAGVVDVTPSALAPLLTERDLPTIFRTCGREDQQADVAARFLLGRHYVKIAVVHDRTPGGKAFADAVRAALAAEGTSEAYYGSFAQDAHDVSGLVKRMRAAGTQIVAWGGGPAGAALWPVSSMRPARMSPLLGGLSMASDDFASLAGTAADGSFVVFPKDPRQQPAAAPLLQSFRAQRIDPYGYTFYAYAAVQVIAQAAAGAHSLDPRVVAAAMHERGPFQTVIGPLAFDRKGDPIATDLTVYVWHKGPTGRMGFADRAKS